MGMAVGVDYSLFYVKREREEKAAGYPRREALHRAAATSGQAVLISGVTVLIAMAGLLLAGSKIFESLGIGAMIVVSMSMVGSLTVLPALLGRLGDRVDRGLVAVLAAAIMAVVRRRPQLLVRLATRRTLLQRARATGSSLASGAPASALAPPSARRGRRLGDAARRARAAGVRHAHEAARLQRPAREPPDRADLPARSSTPFPAPPHPRRWSSRRRRTRRTAAAKRARRAPPPGARLRRDQPPIRIVVNPQHTVAQIDMPLAGNGDDATSFAALQTLRTDVVPAALGTLPGAEYAVTGETAGNADFNGDD